MLTAFTWGYWGWGGSTNELLRMVGAAERASGFAPPIFVDIRITRSVRAPGFNGTAFQKTLGGERYIWIPDLGNRNIVEKKGATDRPRIRRPAAAADLLGHIERASYARRRVIFFCSCPVPAHCHRSLVAGLLLRAARKKGTPITVTEWPGAALRGPSLLVEDAGSKAAFSPKKAKVPLGKKPDLAVLGRIPWGSTVEIRWGRSRNNRAYILAGSPLFARREWHLEKLTDTAVDELEGLVAARRKVDTDRREFGLDKIWVTECRRNDGAQRP